MRPHRLQLSAFGAFAGTVEIDLDRLAESGLFLLHGPTGAGKTTLLDGIGFALFGRVPGARQGAKQLRSDHAAQDVRTEVQLEVTFGARRLRVTRSPDYERPKLRGTGTTTEKARVLLEELVDGAWERRSDRFDEVGLEITDLVGMSAEQFFQVVLLPQGDFAQFLRATSTERAVLLEKLFSTERFGEVEQWLAGRRRTTAEAVAATRDTVDLLVARVGEATGAEPSEGDPSTWATLLLSEARITESLAQQAVLSATTVRDLARAALEEATALHDRQRRRRVALTKLSVLQEQRPAVTALQQEFDAATRAAEVASVLREADDRRTARDQALEGLAVARAGLAVGDRLLDAEQLSALVVEGRERCGRLEALRPLERARTKELETAGSAREEQALALAEAAELEVARASLPLRREQARARQVAARAAAERLPALAAERDALQALVPDLVTLDSLSARIAQLVGRHLSARETAVALQEKANDLRTASINMMIAKLAFALEDDTPCPVCGALDHPEPSPLRDEGVSTEDEDAARLAAEDAAREVADLEALLAADRATVAALSERAAGVTLDAVEARLAELSLDVAVLQASVVDGQRAELALAALEQEQLRASAALVAATSEADTAGRRVEEALGRAEDAMTRLAADLLPAGFRTGSGPEAPDPVHSHRIRSGAPEELPSVDEVLGRVLARTAAADVALAATDALTRAQGELDRALTQAVAAATVKGFADLEEAEEAARTDQWREATAQQLREVVETTAAVKAELADPVLEVELAPPAPVAPCTEAWEQADAVVAERVAEQARAGDRSKALGRLVPELSAALQALAPLEELAAQARRLAELCAGQGQNTLRMTLSSFVLAARLEEVAAAASVRLRRMTQGRYELVHTDGAARGGARSGLGLLARDAWTGQDRDTATLSGGETFLAALALALGLADVVTAEAGGTRMEALFVDEGFGMLDEETLDEVMDVLDGLREGGRLVGLVSHVAELRQRIPARIEVVKTRAGSGVVLHGC